MLQEDDGILGTNYYGHELPDCPGSYVQKCSNDSDFRLPDFGTGPLAVSLTSCSLSVVGSIITILPYLLWKDVRTGLRRVITYLAIADFFTASGYIMASINYIVYDIKTEHMQNHRKGEPCTRFDEVCQIQAYISSWSSYSSFWWTLLLALFFYFAIVKGGTKKVEKYFPLYHVLSWGSPILVMFPLLVTGSLGYSLFAAGGWCFIGGDSEVGKSSFVKYSLSPVSIIKILAGGKAFEIFTYVWIIAMYFYIRCRVRRKREGQHKSELAMDMLAKKSMKQIEFKLFLIPVAFILLRMWGTLQFFFSIIVFHGGQSLVDTKTGCVPDGVYYTYKVLAVFQSFGDGGQGWCNAILYIGLSPSIRERLILRPLYSCLRFFIRKRSHSKSVQGQSTRNFIGTSTVTSCDDTKVIYHSSPPPPDVEEKIDENTPIIENSLHISDNTCNM
ncbi:PREDICTED: probable G-protein coupled receptor 157 isoform X2 [Amphimedon queenslandica]|uniref:G-protein coupled receptors family 2 profile 2 domain-containing protein n=1 Tax=Amphimedon queenslandica TaxID=400682 RepID=A0A1X7VI69_AMPQE|nr:PREDICTED: probable G-protein coupled receptor 157 isoform X2 [Amphimedon queenslandica]|eukprot:XP_019849009.1 PREDICTED: probable G-protein coupled receptor 157 isoform X2 [Amphimedon queenslandica]